MTTFDELHPSLLPLMKSGHYCYADMATQKSWWSSSAVMKACLDKQRVREALDKYAHNYKGHTNPYCGEKDSAGDIIWCSHCCVKRELGL